jgi:hypothetical protein
VQTDFINFGAQNKIPLCLKVHPQNFSGAKILPALLSLLFFFCIAAFLAGITHLVREFNACAAARVCFVLIILPDQCLCLHIIFLFYLIYFSLQIAFFMFSII